MATTLPKIPPGPTQLTGRVPKSPVKPDSGRRKLQSKKERELEQKREVLRSQLPLLGKKDTNEFRNTYLHNVCVSMLEEGFHKSFSEILALIKRQKEDREKAGPDSILWNKIQLYDEHEKLNQLRADLCRAESAARKGLFIEVYDAQWCLAQFFLQHSDKWLSDHFFLSCLQTGRKLTGTNEGKLAEAYCNMGLAAADNGNLMEAAQHFESFYELTAEHKEWQTRENTAMFEAACNHLSSIYTRIAETFGAAQNHEQALEYFSKAHSRADESGNSDLEGRASYRLGEAYLTNEDPKTALKHLTHYFELCEAKKDSDGLGAACEAIARAHGSCDQTAESIQYLEKYVSVSHASGNERALAKACAALGGVYNSLGRYVEATESFNRAYNVSRALNDSESVSQSRVQFGVANAHRMLYNYSRHLNMQSVQCMARMFDWKSSRGDDFEKEIADKESTEVAEPEAGAGQVPGEAEQLSAAAPVQEDDEDES